MSRDDYRQLARRAILQSTPPELLELFLETCQAIAASGQKPEDVFRRVIQQAKQPHDPGSILQQLADLGAIPADCWQTRKETD